MRLEGTTLRLAATDLANHLGCGHLTNLDHRVAHSVLERPKFVDPALEGLAERGRAHETGYLAHLRPQGHTIAELVEGDTSATKNTIAAMRNGTEAPLQSNDVLVVAPYNAQIVALKKALPGMRVGTVDKFQGQEAPVVIRARRSCATP